jgi:hypothetical protein
MILPEHKVDPELTSDATLDADIGLLSWRITDYYRQESRMYSSHIESGDFGGEGGFERCIDLFARHEHGEIIAEGYIGGGDSRPLYKEIIQYA